MEGVATRSQSTSFSSEKKLKQKYQDSFWYINEGINLEEREKPKEAVLCYEKGMRFLEEGLKTYRNMDMQSQSQCIQMKRKMERAKEQVKSRLFELQQTVKNEQDVANAIGADIKDRLSSVDWEDVKELMHITEGVQLFNVDIQTNECNLTLPCDLKVCQFLKDHKDLRVPPAFMLCGDWMFPLDPGVSPVLKSNSNTYMFPDVEVLSEPQEKYNCVGIIFSELVSEEQIARFERILSCYSKFKDNSKQAKPARPPPPREGTEIDRRVVGYDPIKTSRVSDGVHASAKWISSGIEKGAVIGGKLVEKGAEKLKQTIATNESPTVVDPKVAENVQHIKTVTGAAMQVSSYLVSALSALTYQIGRHLAPIVREQGAKLIPKQYKDEKTDGQQTMDNFVELAVAGVQGWATIFLSLEEGAKILYRSVSTATVGLVNHKYGQDAADVTGEAMKAAGNTAQVYLNMKNLGVKAIAKRTAKDTAKTMLSIEHEQRFKDTQQQ